jgi:7,8-dihydropterin-6-yl-methyl-4-(beta-D-ribofuranosyl)aminobenzene 5'-phosphate synthase
MDLSTGSLTLTTVYDNYATTRNVETRHGFACMVEADGRKLLFDTGGEGDVLLANARRLGLDLQEIDALVLSHIHGDHTGGLGALLSVHPKVEVWMPASFPPRFRNQVESAGARVREVTGPARIAAGVATTGEMGERIREQALMINTPNGLVVVTGCAHPGIVEIVERAKALTDRPIHLALGGFHLAGQSDSRLRRVLAAFKRLGVEKIAPCHCSGDRIRERAKELYSDDFLPNGVGMVVEIGKEPTGKTAERQRQGPQ